jgi:hypothetical protein
MGLDQYLYRKSYVRNWEHQSDDLKHEITILQGGQPRTDIQPERITYIVETAIQWRKANQIHKWFVDNVQDGEDDCGQHYVSREQLGVLRDLCKEVLDSKHQDIAEQLLPTSDGFFFGSDEYDEWYWSDVQETYNELSKLLETDNQLKRNYEVYYEYSSSW